MARKRRTLYDRDGTVVEQIVGVGVGDEVSVMKTSASVPSVFSMDGDSTLTGKEFSTSDVFDTFVGYINPRIEIMIVDDDGEGNKCLICGADTNKNIRKICFDCMKKHRDDLYTKMKSAIISGDKEIRF